MSFATTRDAIRPHYETAGSGTSLVFVHEFSGDARRWEPQLRFFARRHRGGFVRDCTRRRRCS